jgi:hypothetical protein
MCAATTGDDFLATISNRRQKGSGRETMILKANKYYFIRKTDWLTMKCNSSPVVELILFSILNTERRQKKGVRSRNHDFISKQILLHQEN